MSNTYKKIIFGKESRKNLKDGVDSVANPVKVTLGPRGRNVVIGKIRGVPQVTKDGVTVAREINLVNYEKDMGAQLMKQVALQTLAQAGDGTTTATVLAQAIVSEGLKYVEMGANPVDLKIGIDAAVKKVAEFISKFSKKVTNESHEIEQIATISANNDNAIGKIIAEAMQKVGVDGMISARESKGVDTTVEVVDGMQVSRGFGNPYFVTDPHRMMVDLKDVYVLLYDKRISQIKEIAVAAEVAIETGKGLVIFSDGVDGEALKTLIANKLDGRIRVAAVAVPGMGIYKKDILEDIASVVNGKVISPDAGVLLSTMGEDSIKEYFGTVERITMDRNTTVIINEKANVSRKVARVKELKSQLEKAKDDDEKDYLKERLAKITGGVGMISVGAPTEVEMSEKKDRIDDAICATKAAVEEGIVPGGGCVYIRALKALEHHKIDPDYTIVDKLLIFFGLKKRQPKSDDRIIGGQIVRRAMLAPFSQILYNSGFERRTEDIIESIAMVHTPGGGYGFNSRTEKFEDFYSTGIIDPAKVSRVALENAASIAGMILTTECVLSLETEENRG